MKCLKCGYENQQIFKFCPQCGNQVITNYNQVTTNKYQNNYTNNQQNVSNIQYQNNYTNNQQNVSNIQYQNNYTNNQQNVSNIQYRNNYTNNQQNVSNIQYRNNYTNNQQNVSNIQYQNNQYQNNQYNNTYNPNTYYQQSNNMYQKNGYYVAPKKNNSKLVLIPICIVFLFLGIFFITQILNVGPKIYINMDDSNQNYNDSNVTINNYGNNSSKSTNTVIDNSKQYVSNINSVNDIKKFIKNESAEQRKNCPTYNNSLDLQIENKYDIAGVNFCEIDKNFLKELLNVIDYYYTTYPEIRGYLNNFTITGPGAGMSPGVIAYFRPSYPTLISEDGNKLGLKLSINMISSYFLDKDSLIQTMNASSQTGHFPPNTTAVSPVAHEIGHYLSFISLVKEYKLDDLTYMNPNNLVKYNQVNAQFSSGEYSKKLIEEAYNNYKKDTGSTIGFDEFRASISKYAVAKDSAGEYIYDETIAESVHDVYLNRENAKAASKYINAVLIERLKK